jgi:alpha-L-rhamnosidase
MLIHFRKTFFFLLLIIFAVYAQAQNPINLKTENAQNPQGLSEFKPKFSWQIKAVTKNSKQTAYQLIVSSTEVNLKKNIGDIWDSKKVNSPNSENITFAGKVLEPTKKYYWKVKIWNEKAKVSAWSEAQYFVMGTLKKTDWIANWIGKTESGGKPSKALDFQKEFKLAKRATKAKIFVTGLGAYYLTLNGKKVGNDYLATGMTQLSDTLYYQTYEIDPEAVSVGTNFISATVGNGWLGSGNNLVPNSILGDGSNRFYFQLEFYFYDGSSQIIASDASWQVRNSATIVNSLYTGETLDGLAEYNKDWKNADILDESSQKVTVFEVGAAKGKEKVVDYITKNKVLMPLQKKPIQVAEEIKAVEFKSPKRNQYVYDFGKVITGFVQLSIEGKADKEVEIIFSETLDKKGFVDQSAMKIKPRDVYSLKGYSTEIWEPKFTFHKFRYAQISGYSGKADINSLLAKALVNCPELNQ